MLGLGLGLSCASQQQVAEVPATIADLSAEAQSDTEVLLTFTPASGATGHEYRIDGGSAVACDDNSGLQTVSGLTAETEYDFEVRGTNAEGNGAWSNVATETTEAEEVPISAPVLTLTSDAGNPVEVDIAVDGTVAAGMYWRMQVAGDSAFTTPLFGEGAIRETFRPITMADFGSTPDLFDCLANQPNGDTYVRLRVERDDGEASDWSNTVSDTVSVLVPSTFDPLNKNAYVTLSNGNLTLRSVLDGVGAACASRATNSRSGKVYIEMMPTEITEDASLVGFGVCSSALNMASFLSYGPGANAERVLWRGDGYLGEMDGDFPRYGVDWVEDDIVHIAFDTGARLLWVGVNGTWLNGDPGTGTGGTPAPDYDSLFAFAYAVPTSGGQRTIDFIPDGDTYLPSGFEVYV